MNLLALIRFSCSICHSSCLPMNMTNSSKVSDPRIGLENRICLSREMLAWFSAARVFALAVARFCGKFSRS